MSLLVKHPLNFATQCWRRSLTHMFTNVVVNYILHLLFHNFIYQRRKTAQHFRRNCVQKYDVVYCRLVVVVRQSGSFQQSVFFSILLVLLLLLVLIFILQLFIILLIFFTFTKVSSGFHSVLQFLSKMNVCPRSRFTLFFILAYLFHQC